MKIHITAFWALAFLCLHASCQRKTFLQLSPTTQNIQIDGQIGDWQPNFTASSAFPDLLYQINATNDYVYICTRTLNQQYQSWIIAQGMGVWVDTLHRQNAKMGIQFPLPITDAHIKQLAKHSQSDNARALHKAYADICTEFEMVGFAPEPLRASNVSSQHIKAALGYDELGEMVCEYRIPWKFIYQGHPINWNEKISIGIKFNEPARNPQDDDTQGNPNSQINNPLGQGQTNPSNPLNPMAGANPNNPNSAIGRNTASFKSQPTFPNVWIAFQLTKPAN
jgi:hypothetical protein